LAELNELLNEEKASEERILEAAKELETAIELETAKLLEESELVPEDPPYFIPPATDPTYDSVETITTIEDTVADSDLVIMFEPDISKIPAIIEEWNIKHPEQCLCVIDVPPINKEIYMSQADKTACCEYINLNENTYQIYLREMKHYFFKC